MDYSRYNTGLTFYVSEDTVDEELNSKLGVVLKEAFKTIGSVTYVKVQEYSLNERELKRGTIRVLWHPKLSSCTHVKVQTYYENEIYKIELQQVPFADGEVEIAIIKEQ